MIGVPFYTFNLAALEDILCKLPAGITYSLLGEMTSGSLIHLQRHDNAGLRIAQSVSDFSKPCCIGMIQCSQFGVPKTKMINGIMLGVEPATRWFD